MEKIQDTLPDDCLAWVNKKRKEGAITVRIMDALRVIMIYTQSGRYRYSQAIAFEKLIDAEAGWKSVIEWILRYMRKELKKGQRYRGGMRKPWPKVKRCNWMMESKNWEDCNAPASHTHNGLYYCPQHASACDEMGLGFDLKKISDQTV